MNKHSRIILITYFSLWLGYFILFWSQAITFDQAGNIVAGHANIWGDWAAHFTMGSRMAFDKLFLFKSPFVINQTFSYPFISNFISALLVRIGMDFFNAFIIPSFILSLAIIWAIYFFYKQLFKSLTTAIIASLLFLFNGGFGFIYFIKHIIESKTPWLTFLNPPQQYTNIEPLLYRWISVIDSMIIPQRAFSLGFPLTLIALAWCWKFIFKAKPNHKIKHKQLIIPIITLGLMPLIHTHSFLAAFIILGVWMIGDLVIHYWNKKYLQKWLPLGLGVALIALPIIKVFLYSQVSTEFIKWFPGWYSHDYPDQNWFLFWIKNWGFIPLLAILGFIEITKKKRCRSLWFITFLPFFTIFILLNLFLFQPFIWDNTKLLVWTSVGFSGLAAYFLGSMWHKKRFYQPLAKILVTLLFITSISSGLIDAYRNVRFKLHSHIMYSQEEVQLSNWTKENTSPNSIWLTGSNHNHWLFNLTGRQALMTYPGWLWTHGYQTQKIEQDISQMFQEPKQKKLLFDEYGVDYIIIGPDEQKRWQAQNSNFQHLTLIKASKNYHIYAY